MEEQGNTYYFYDSSIIVRTAIRNDRETYHAIFECLGRNGFVITRDRNVVKSIRKDFHYAQKCDLQARLEVHPVCINVEFYQDVVHENPYGGRHDFDKVAKMPYHIRLYFQAMRKRIAAMLESRGFIDVTETKHEDQFEYAMNTWSRRSNRTPTDQKDRDGEILVDGELRYARDYSGYLFRGQIFWDGGNMWNVVANSKVRRRFAAYELFKDSSNEPRKRNPRRISRLESELNKAVNNLNFERAIVFRDLLGAKPKAA